ncbi:MAG: phosphoribosylamine--glycine ligase [Sphingobacteriales bacterium]|nr:phosphoribosylamine--glycine ligase [Sphingobacteriales bacterium]
MNILIIGRGGREHCLAWKCRRHSGVQQIYVAKGNDGMCEVAQIVDIDENDISALAEFALQNAIDLTIVGTETPLEKGITDVFRQHGLRIFAPTQAAARIETSKDFAKQLMQRAHIPTAQAATFTDAAAARQYVLQKGVPVVIKNDGLAAGKGVVVAMDEATALEAVDLMLLHQQFGSQKILIEEYLEGEEFTLMCLVNGRNYIALPLSQDHKRAYNGDVGPNTGGMGAYTPVPQIHCTQEALQRVVEPLLRQMEEDGYPFCGFLYAGLMQTAEGVKVIEFNARFGDPECEVLLPALRNDLVADILELLDGKSTTAASSAPLSTLGVVLCAEGYPQQPHTGFPLHFPASETIQVFHAGSKKVGDAYVSNGGRVAVIVAQGETLQTAQQKAYQYIENMQLSEHFFYRNDIGQKGIAAEKSNLFIQT